MFSWLSHLWRNPFAKKAVWTPSVSQRLLADFIISRIRAETGMSFDIAESGMIWNPIHNLAKASLADGRFHAFLNMFAASTPSRRPPVAVFNSEESEFQVQFFYYENFQEPRENHFIHLHDIITRAVADFPSIAASVSLESATLICMELQGEHNAGLFQWTEEAARKLGGTVELFPGYIGPNHDPPTYWVDNSEGRIWAQIRLAQPQPLENILADLGLEPTKITRTEICRQFDADSEDRQAFGLKCVHLKHRTF